MTRTTTKQDFALVWVYAITPPGDDREPSVSLHTSLDNVYKELRYDLSMLRREDTSDVSDAELIEKLEELGDWAITVYCTPIDTAALVRVTDRPAVKDWQLALSGGKHEKDA